MNAFIKQTWKKFKDFLTATNSYCEQLQHEIPTATDKLHFQIKNLDVIPYIPEPIDGELELKEDLIHYWWVMQ